MSIQSVSSQTDIYQALSGSYQEKVEEEDPLGRDAFLTMMVAQLEHQDPLNPMEGSDFSSQLAQFSSLEQLMDVNDNIINLQNSMASSNEGNLIDYIGKEVVSQDNTINVQDGEAMGGYFTTAEDGDIMVTVYDASGSEVAYLYPGNLEAGVHAVEWDGTDLNGQRVSDGTYSFSAVGLNENGAYINVQTSMRGYVEGVTYNDGTPYLVVNGVQVDPDAVSEVWADPAATEEDDSGIVSDIIDTVSETIS